MPKVRRQRTKYHYSKPEEPQKSSVGYDLSEITESLREEAAPTPANDELSNSTDIDSTAGQASAVLSKKAKRESRRNEWLKKMGAIHSQQVRAKEAKKRQQTAVVGDVMPLHDALDEMAQILATTSSSKGKARLEQQEKGRARVVSRNKRRMVLADENKRFQAVLSNHHFKANPLNAVAQHLKRSCNTS